MNIRIVFFISYLTFYLGNIFATDNIHSIKLYLLKNCESCKISVHYDSFGAIVRVPINKNEIVIDTNITKKIFIISDICDEAVIYLDSLVSDTVKLNCFNESNYGIVVLGKRKKMKQKVIGDKRAGIVQNYEVLNSQFTNYYLLNGTEMSNIQFINGLEFYIIANNILHATRLTITLYDCEWQNINVRHFSQLDFSSNSIRYLYSFNKIIDSSNYWVLQKFQSVEFYNNILIKITAEIDSSIKNRCYDTVLLRRNYTNEITKKSSNALFNFYGPFLAKNGLSSKWYINNITFDNKNKFISISGKEIPPRIKIHGLQRKRKEK